MKIDVFDTMNSTFLGTLTEAFGIGFLDDLTIPGFARFQLDAASTADLALCAPRRVVRFRTGVSPGVGDVFAGIVQDRPTSLSDDVQPVGAVSTVTVECRGLLAWLGNREGGAVLYPSMWPGGRRQNPRVFGPMSPDFDITGWTVPAGDGPLSTEGWPDEAASGFLTPSVRTWYRRVLPATAGDAGPARMFLVGTWRSNVRVWLDGEIVLEKPAGQTGLFVVDIAYEAVDHVVALEVTGVPDVNNRVGWTWMRLIDSVDADGNETLELGSVIRRTFAPADFPDADTSWQQWDAVANGEPGVSVGFVMDVALSEDQARNARPWSWTFDNAVDSAGVAWPVKFTRGFRVQEVGRVLDECVSIDGEPEMTPDGTFNYFVKRGTDRTATVTVTSPFALELTGRGVQATRYFYETQTGFGQVVDVAAEAALGVVMERFVQFGADISVESSAEIIDQQLARDAVTSDEVSVDLPDDVVPYVDVFVGDTVTCVGRDGTAPVRLTSLQATVDDANGHVDWTATAKPAA